MENIRLREYYRIWRSIFYLLYNLYVIHCYPAKITLNIRRIKCQITLFFRTTVALSIVFKHLFALSTGTGIPCELLRKPRAIREQVKKKKEYYSLPRDLPVKSFDRPTNDYNHSENTHLRHVSDAFSRHSAALRSGFSAEYEDLSGVQSPSTNDTAEQCGLSTTTGSQQSVSVMRCFILVKLRFVLNNK